MKKQEEVKCIIKKITPQKPIDNAHLANIYGREMYSKPTYYQNLETKDEYRWIGGGIAWPGDQDCPGAVAIVAVKKEKKEIPTYIVLDAAESDDPEVLLNECLYLRVKWGYEKCENILNLWHGPSDELETLISNFNSNLRGTFQGSDNFFSPPLDIFFSPPLDYEKQNRFEIYLRHIQSLLKKDESDQKRLYFGDCDMLRNRFHHCLRDAPSKGTIEKYPAVAALGYALHSLSVQRPWMAYTPDQAGDWEEDEPDWDDDDDGGYMPDPGGLKPTRYGDDDD